MMTCQRMTALCTYIWLFREQPSALHNNPHNENYEALNWRVWLHTSSCIERSGRGPKERRTHDIRPPSAP